MFPFFSLQIPCIFPCFQLKSPVFPFKSPVISLFSVEIQFSFQLKVEMFPFFSLQIHCAFFKIPCSLIFPTNPLCFLCFRFKPPVFSLPSLQIHYIIPSNSPWFLCFPFKSCFSPISLQIAMFSLLPLQIPCVFNAFPSNPVFPPISLQIAIFSLFPLQIPHVFSAFPSNLLYSPFPCVNSTLPTRL